MRSCIETVANAESGSRLTMESTASRNDEYGWHEGGLVLSSSRSAVPETISRDKTVRGATLDNVTKHRRAGSETGGNEHRDQAKRASAKVEMHVQPERESVMLRKDYVSHKDNRDKTK